MPKAMVFVQNLAKGCRGDGKSGVGHVTDHDGVDDAHRHPTELGEDKRQGQGEHGTNLAAY